MKSLLLFMLAAVLSLQAADQLTVHKIQLNTPAGAINGKVVGVGDHLVFIDDDQPQKSFLIQRGDIRTARSQDNSIIVEMARPVTDRFGSRSNLEIRLIDPSTGAVLSKHLGVPVERARTETTYSLDVRHDHRGQGHCEGRLIADDTRIRFESVGQASHSRNWTYDQVERFLTERNNAILRVDPVNGDTYDFNVVNGATAGAMHKLVSEKIIAARPVR
jgi:hypothetical protein